jgi:hypothetical protein
MHEFASYSIEVSSATDDTQDTPSILAKYSTDSVLACAQYLGSAVEFFTGEVRFGTETRIVILVGTFGYYQVITIEKDPVTGTVTVK